MQYSAELTEQYIHYMQSRHEVVISNAEAQTHLDSLANLYINMTLPPPTPSGARGGALRTMPPDVLGAQSAP